MPKLNKQGRKLMQQIGIRNSMIEGKYTSRPMNIHWLESLIEYGQLQGIPIFVKQLGSSYAQQNGFEDWAGGDISEWATPLRVRQFPITL